MSAADASKASINADGLSKNQKKKLKKQQAKEAKTGSVTADKEPEEAATKPSKKDDGLAKKASKRTTLPSGLSFTDAKTGDGPVAKKGQKVSVRYIGKLDSGKVFDSNTKGKAFTFTLGAGVCLSRKLPCLY
jgi:FK506-binding nuclear protein